MASHIPYNVIRPLPINGAQPLIPPPPIIPPGELEPPIEEMPTIENTPPRYYQPYPPYIRRPSPPNPPFIRIPSPPNLWLPIRPLPVSNTPWKGGL